MENNNDLDKNLIAGHEYDGIKELDNPLPKWWQFIFYATIIFSAGYYWHYELSDGPTLKQELDTELAVYSAEREKVAAAQPKAEDVDFNTLIQDEAAMKRAADHFTSKCAACHGTKGEGLIGPNLTDNYWIHGKGEFATINKVLAGGVLDKGMPPWKGVIPDKEIMEVSAYIITMKGSNPPNAKAPQGELVE